MHRCLQVRRAQSRHDTRSASRPLLPQGWHPPLNSILRLFERAARRCRFYGYQFVAVRRSLSPRYRQRSNSTTIFDKFENIVLYVRRRRARICWRERWDSWREASSGSVWFTAPCLSTAIRGGRPAPRRRLVRSRRPVWSRLAHMGCPRTAAARLKGCAWRWTSLRPRFEPATRSARRRRHPVWPMRQGRRTSLLRRVVLLPCPPKAVSLWPLPRRTLYVFAAMRACRLSGCEVLGVSVRVDPRRFRSAR